MNLDYAILSKGFMEHLYWSDWVRNLQRRNMTGMALTLLDGVGPVRFIFSQLMLATLPFIDDPAHPSWKAFAEMIEDPQESRSFLAYLREEKSC